MSAPIYFFPGAKRAELVDGLLPRRAALEERGVWSAFRDITDVDAQTSCWDLTALGPGGASGLLWTVLNAAGELPQKLGYYPALQTWHERPAGANCWIGIETAKAPTPADLRRRRRYRGHEVTLADGNAWEVPVLRAPNPYQREDYGRSALPRTIAYDAAGGVVRKLQPSYRALWELSGEFWDHLFDREHHPGMPWTTIMDLAVGALALNYRLGPAEVTVLELIDTTNWEELLQATLDMPLLDIAVDAQKKTDDPPPGSPSSSGNADAPPSTGPAAPSSS